MNMKKPHPELVQLGMQIRQLRESKGFSQDEFAAELGMSRSYYSAIERGVHNISTLKLSHIAQQLGVANSKLWALVEKKDGSKKKD